MVRLSLAASQAASLPTTPGSSKGPLSWGVRLASRAADPSFKEAQLALLRGLVSSTAGQERDRMRPTLDSAHNVRWS